MSLLYAGLWVQSRGACVSHRLYFRAELLVVCAWHVRGVEDHSLSAVLIKWVRSLQRPHPRPRFIISKSPPGSQRIYACFTWLPCTVSRVEKEGKEATVRTSPQLDDLHWDKGTVNSSCSLPSPGRTLLHSWRWEAVWTKEYSGKNPSY